MGVQKKEPERQARTPLPITQRTSRSPKSKACVLFRFGDIPHRGKDNLRSTGTSLMMETWGKFYLPERSVQGFVPGSFLQRRPEAPGTGTSLRLVCEPTPPMQASLVYWNSSCQMLDNPLLPEASNPAACSFSYTLPLHGHQRAPCTWQI